MWECRLLCKGEVKEQLREKTRTRAHSRLWSGEMSSDDELKTAYVGKDDQDCAVSEHGASLMSSEAGAQDHHYRGNEVHVNHYDHGQTSSKEEQIEDEKDEMRRVKENKDEERDRYDAEEGEQTVSENEVQSERGEGQCYEGHEEERVAEGVVDDEGQNKGVHEGHEERHDDILQAGLADEVDAVASEPTREDFSDGITNVWGDSHND